MSARTIIRLWMAAAVLVPALGVAGALFKIQHWPMADGVLIISGLISMAASLLIGLKIPRYPGFKDFLDS